jgi:putative transposase
MTRDDESNPFQTVLQLLIEEGFDGFASALEILVNEAMKLERAAVLHAEPYQRTTERRGYANGFKPKTVLSRLGKLQLAIPQTRGVEFYPSALERGERSERALKLALAEMYVQGVSTRKVAAITRELCGTEVTSMQVSRAAALLDEELSAWRNRPLGRTPFVQLDARYEKVRHGGRVVDCALLVATAVTPDGKRTILGLSVSLSEAEVHWRAFLQALIARGCTASNSSPATITPDSSRRGRRASREFPCSAVSFTCNKTPRVTCRGKNSRLPSPPICGPSSPLPIAAKPIVCSTP